MKARGWAAAALAVAAVLAGCGSSSGTTVSVPAVAPARVFTLGHFQPAGPITAGRPTTMSFDVQLPKRQAADPVQDRHRPPHRRCI